MIDIAFIKIQAGKGGDGAATFRREKFIPKGGPDGGDGGDGGNVYFVADSNMATLADFRSKPSYKAQNGDGGGKKKMYGIGGNDLYIKVPLGTLIYEVRNGREILMGDLSVVGATLLACQGGRGGKGNFKFRSSTNQTPVQYTKGTVGEARDIKLEVRLIADIGLVGLPNAGKSTLINQLTNVNAKVANYPFTTLSPNLGVMRVNPEKTVVIADIPGLIEGASSGKGLGDEFLRHVRRTSILIHVVDPLDNGEIPEDVLEVCLRNYSVIREELKAYSNGVDLKHEIIVINKVDLTEVREALPLIVSTFESKFSKEVMGISAYTAEGIQELANVINTFFLGHPELNENKEFEQVVSTKQYNLFNMPNRRMVFQKPDEIDPPK